MVNADVPLAVSTACNRTKEGQCGNFSGQHIVIDIAMEKKIKSPPLGGINAAASNGNKLGNGWGGSAVPSIACRSGGITPARNGLVKKVGQRKRMDHRSGGGWFGSSVEESGSKKNIQVRNNCVGSGVGLGCGGDPVAPVQTSDVGGVPNELGTAVFSTCCDCYEDRDWRHGPQRIVQLDGIAVAELNSNKEMYRRNVEHVPYFANDSCG